MKRLQEVFHYEKKDVDFNDIDRQLLEGFECSQFNNQNKRFLSMIKEQTHSALNNKRYWSANG